MLDLDGVKVVLYARFGWSEGSLVCQRNDGGSCSKVFKDPISRGN